MDVDGEIDTLDEDSNSRGRGRGGELFQIETYLPAQVTHPSPCREQDIDATGEGLGEQPVATPVTTLMQAVFSVDDKRWSSKERYQEARGSGNPPNFEQNPTFQNFELCQQSLYRLRTDEDEFRRWLYASARPRRSLKASNLKARNRSVRAIAKRFAVLFDFSNHRSPLRGFQNLVGTFQIPDRLGISLGILFFALFFACLLVSWPKIRSRRLRLPAVPSMAQDDEGLAGRNTAS